MKKETKKILKIIVITVVSLIVFLNIIDFVDTASRGQNLGEDLGLLEGEYYEDKTIVYCSSKNKKWGFCDGGYSILPTSEMQYDDDGEYYEYVKEAKSDENWILAKTFVISENKNSYYIIDKSFTAKTNNYDGLDFINFIQSHVIGPLDLQTFNQKLEELNIDLQF